MRAFIFLAAICCAFSVHAQQQQTYDELQAQYLFETGQLRQALGQEKAQAIQLRKENAELRAKQETKPEVKQ